MICTDHDFKDFEAFEDVLKFSQTYLNFYCQYFISISQFQKPNFQNASKSQEGSNWLTESNLFKFDPF